MSNPGKLPPKPLAAAPLAHVFAADARIVAWTARLKAEAALTALIRRQLPRPLADRVRVTGILDGAVELASSTGAVAAAVRQRLPDVIASLRREGCDFTEIRVRVQVGGGARPENKSLCRQMDARAFAMLDLAARLPECPLKDALDRWSRRARGRVPR
ncbi:MAG: hypothetical protein ABJB78_08290 [Betaproteobacteria bacterium]